LTRAGGPAFDVRQVPGGCLYASALGLRKSKYHNNLIQQD
jgi:hypothetical protein